MTDKTVTAGTSSDSVYVDVAVEVFRLLSDATRIRIILALSEHRELSVNHLAQLVHKAPTATSQHLARLRAARVVSARQDGNRMIYRLTDEHARELVTQAVLQAEHILGERPPHHQ